jgi:hypothetical protein
VQDGSSGWNGPGDQVGGLYFASLPGECSSEFGANSVIAQLLEPLADNGGPTETMALRTGISILVPANEGTDCVTRTINNPAIDQGDSFGLTTDQRGYPRPVDLLGLCNTCVPGDYSDIGAYEVQTVNSPPSPPPHQPFPFFPLDFVSVAGATSTVQSTANLVSGTWTDLPGIFVGNGGIMDVVITNSPGLTKQFYRVATSVQGEPYSLPYVSFDNTLGPVYSNGWTSASNSGRGFGPWTLTETSTNINSDGFFVGSSTNNGNGTNDIDVGGTSWGLYANSGNLAVAYRAFSNSLAAGGALRVDLDNGYVNASGTVGFVLRNGNFTGGPTNYTTGARLQFLYVGFDSSNSYKVVDSGGQHNLGVPLTLTGLHLLFTLNTTNTYTLLTIDNASGNTNSTFSGTLGGTSGSTVDSIALFNNNAGAGSSNNVYFNTLQTVSP